MFDVAAGMGMPAAFYLAVLIQRRVRGIRWNRKCSVDPGKLHGFLGGVN
jgi:hypothetical protein